MVLWVLVGVGALGLRLACLGAAPLSASEARQALLTWRAVTGQGMPGPLGYSPLLFSANALLFLLFGAADATARLWPALFGTALALTPLLFCNALDSAASRSTLDLDSAASHSTLDSAAFRWFPRRMGRVGALAAGAYLALSPTALLASRQLDGASVAAAGLMVALGGVLRFRQARKRGWLALSAVGVALALAGSSTAYGLILALILAWLILRIAWPAPDDLDGDDADPARGIAQYASHLALVFLIAVLAFTTGLGWNVGGLGTAGDLLSRWAVRFAPALDPVASPLILLAVYEPLGLLFGLGGLIQGLRRRRRWEAFLGLWAGAALLLLFLMPGREPLDLLWVVLPLALLTGAALEALVRGLRERGEWLSEGLYVPIVVILWGNVYLMLARYAMTGVMVHLAVAVLALVLQMLLALVFALTVGGDAALRALSAGTGAVLLMGTLAAAWGLAYARPTDPRELLLQQPTAPGVRDLVHTLRNLSWQETGTSTRLPFTVAVEAPFGPVGETGLDGDFNPSTVLLAWYLRDFDVARQVENLETIGGEASADEMDEILVTAGRELEGLGDAASAYMGQDFVLRQRWDLTQIRCAWQGEEFACADGVKWWLFRDMIPSPEPDAWAALWLRQRQQ